MGVDGQTGSGKTYTMQGEADAGITPRAVNLLFGAEDGVASPPRAPPPVRLSEVQVEEAAVAAAKSSSFVPQPDDDE